MSMFILNITTVCNQKCVFCLDADLSRGGRELDLGLERTKEIIDEAKRRGFEGVLFMGGETNILQDFPAIVGYVAASGMRPWVATNGTRLDDEAFVRDMIFERGLYGIELSYHSHREDVANRLSGSSRTWRRQEEAVRNLVRVKREVAGTPHDFELIFNTVVTSWTYEDLRALVEHLVEAMPGEFFARFKFKSLRVCGRARENREIVPRFSAASPHLVSALEYAARRHIDCFVETTPLCFLPGFEHCSLETDNIVRQYVYGGWNFHSGLHTGLVEKGGYNDSYVKPRGCAGCTLGPVCAGVWRQYVDVFGDAEFRATTRDPVAVARRVMGEAA